jgi:hypothetical protein
LATAALEDGAVKIEAEALGWHGPAECEKPFPTGTLELFEVALAKTGEVVSHGVGAGKSLDV